MRNEISQKDICGPKGPPGSKGGDRQGESGRMIWAAARGGGGRPPFTKSRRAESLLGALALASSNRAGTKLSMLRFLPNQTNQACSQDPGVFFRGQLSLGWAFLFAPLCFLPLPPSLGPPSSPLPPLLCSLLSPLFPSLGSQCVSGKQSKQVREGMQSSEVISRQVERRCKAVQWSRILRTPASDR